MFSHVSDRLWLVNDSYEENEKKKLRLTLFLVLRTKNNAIAHRHEQQSVQDVREIPRIHF